MVKNKTKIRFKRIYRTLNAIEITKQKILVTKGTWPLLMFNVIHVLGLPIGSTIKGG